MERRYRAGESLEDYCRACKTDRQHTVIAADADGQPLRVSCGYCGSEHNYRGGPRRATSAEASSSTRPREALAAVASRARATVSSRQRSRKDRATP